MRLRGRTPLSPESTIRDKQITKSKGKSRSALERPFFAQQRIKRQEDGSVILHLKTSGRHDVKRWVMGIGPGAVVLEPEDLRLEIADDLQRSLSAHLAPETLEQHP